MVHFDEVIGPGVSDYTLSSASNSRVFLVDAVASTVTGSDSFYINVPSIADGSYDALFAEGDEFTFYVTSIPFGGPIEFAPVGSVVILHGFNRLLTINGTGGKFTLTKVRAHVNNTYDTWVLSGDLDFPS